MTSTCRTCKWADTQKREGPRALHGYAPQEGYARCRRYPPPFESDRAVHVYPSVSLLDWCGEHSPRAEGDQR